MGKNNAATTEEPEREPLTHILRLERQDRKGDPVGVDIESKRDHFGSTVRVSGGDTLRFESTKGEDFSLAFPIVFFKRKKGKKTRYSTGGLVVQASNNRVPLPTVELLVKDKDIDEVRVNQPYYYYICMAEKAGTKKIDEKDVDDIQIWVQDPDSWMDDC